LKGQAWPDKQEKIAYASAAQDQDAPMRLTQVLKPTDFSMSEIACFRQLFCFNTA